MDDIIQQHAVYSDSDRRALKLAMSLSLLIGFLMLAIKTGAYMLTGSAAILSDAAESVVHVAAVALLFTAFGCLSSLRMPPICMVTRKSGFSLREWKAR